MNDIRVTHWDCENTLNFPSEETSLGSRLPSHLPKGDVPCPSSLSHGYLHHELEHSITLCELCNPGFGDESKFYLSEIVLN